MATYCQKTSARARHQQQDEHYPSKHCFVEMAVKLHAEPGAYEQYW